MMSDYITLNPTVNSLNLGKAISDLRIDATKKLDDLIYQLENDTTVTANDLWVKLKAAQDSTTTESAYICVGILNQLKARKQISDW